MRYRPCPENWIRMLEVGLILGPETDNLYTKTGEQVISLTSGGIRLEGETTPTWYASVALAQIAYKCAFEDYKASVYSRLSGEDVQNAKLFWRQKPEITELIVKGEGESWAEWTIYLFCIHSRLLISAKPMIEAKEA